MAKLRCIKCNFKWTAKTDRIPLHCPYCSKENSIIDQEKELSKFTDVDDILK